MEKKKKIAVWFSCGAASAVATFLTIYQYSKDYNILVFNNPVDEEDEDNLRFKKDIEKWLDIEIIECTNKDLPTNSAEDIWIKRRFMAGNGGAPCTMLLKREARYQAELNYDIDYHVLGFTIEEKHRHERFTKYERGNVIPVLIDEMLTKNDCFQILQQNGIKLPRVYDIFDNANCIGCVKAAGVDYWQKVRKHYPKVFKRRCKLSRAINCKLVKYKGKRIFLDELPIDAVGRKSSRAECSIFCQLPKFYKK